MVYERKLSIYVAEFRNSGDEGNGGLRYHTALLLVDEGQDSLQIAQELHFNDYAADMMDELQGLIRIVPNVRQGKSTKRPLDDLRLYPIIGGYETTTMPLWNHMLKHAVTVKEADLLFDYHDRHLPHANNCRAGTVSALASIGVGVEDEYYASDAGTKAGRITIQEIFSFAHAHQQGVNELRSENAKLMLQLLPPWEHANRFQLSDLASRPN